MSCYPQYVLEALKIIEALTDLAGALGLGALLGAVLGWWLQARTERRTRFNEARQQTYGRFLASADTVAGVYKRPPFKADPIEAWKCLEEIRGEIEITSKQAVRDAASELVRSLQALREEAFFLIDTGEADWMIPSNDLPPDAGEVLGKYSDYRNVRRRFSEAAREELGIT